MGVRRILVTIFAFVVFPAAALVAADTWFIAARFTRAFESAMVESLDTEAGRQALSEELTEGFLNESDLTLSRSEISAISDELAATDRIRVELNRYFDDFTNATNGPSDVIPTVDLRPALDEAREEIDPEHFDLIAEHTEFEVPPEDIASARDFFRLLTGLKVGATIVSVVALLSLLAAARSVSAIAASLAFVLGPLVLLQTVVMAAVDTSPDSAVEEAFLQRLASEWTMLNVGLGVIATSSFVLFLVLRLRTAAEQAISRTTPQDGDGYGGKGSDWKTPVANERLEPYVPPAVHPDAPNAPIPPYDPIH